MAQNIVGKIPDFTDAPASEEVKEEVKEIPAEEAEETEKETPELPAEKPAVPETDDDTKESPVVDDKQEITDALRGLQEERVKLLREISELRGQRRELKQEELKDVQKQIDDLKDIHPDDAATIDRVLKAKGYVSKEEVNKMFYETVKQEELDKFLEKFPEYKPENDPNDSNWAALQKELGYYRMPTNPRQVHEILERAHKAIVRIPSGRSLPAQKRQVEIASAGAGGTQRPSSTKPVNPHIASLMRTHMQGWSEEEIQNLEKKLE